VLRLGCERRDLASTPWNDACCKLSWRKQAIALKSPKARGSNRSPNRNRGGFIFHPVVFPPRHSFDPDFEPPVISGWPWGRALKIQNAYFFRGELCCQNSHFAAVTCSEFVPLGNPLEFPPLGPAKTLRHRGDTRNVRNV
jgi:hypothetical protein